MKILIEVPDNWLDGDYAGNIEFITRTCKQVITQRLTDKMLDEVIEKTPVPKIEISKEELKSRMLDILANRALEKSD